MALTAQYMFGRIVGFVVFAMVTESRLRSGEMLESYRPVHLA